MDNKRAASVEEVRYSVMFSVMEWFTETVTKLLDQSDVDGKKVIDIGSRYINGSFKHVLVALGASEYLGVDLEEGDGVDLVADIASLKHFAPESFDIVVCTETLEHIKTWEDAILIMDRLLKKNGLLFLTAPTKGFPRHSFPSDYWRFDAKGFSTIFANNYELISLNQDPKHRNVQFCGRKKTPVLSVPAVAYPVPPEHPAWKRKIYCPLRKVLQKLQLIE